MIWNLMVIIFANLSLIFNGYVIYIQRKSRNLISAETKRKIAHTKVFEKESDPESIIAEMNRNADFMESRTSGRLTAPRPDAGSPAVVHRPPIRSVQPRGDDRKFFQNLANQVDKESDSGLS